MFRFFSISIIRTYIYDVGRRKNMQRPTLYNGTDSRP